MPTYLTTPEVATALRLLRVLEVQLKSSIETSCLPGTEKPDPRDVNAAHNVRLDRRDLKAAQGLVAKIERRVRRGP